MTLFKVTQGPRPEDHTGSHQSRVCISVARQHSTVGKKSEQCHQVQNEKLQKLIAKYHHRSQQWVGVLICGVVVGLSDSIYWLFSPPPCSQGVDLWGGRLN
jgi:hypothetical protein